MPGERSRKKKQGTEATGGRYRSLTGFGPYKSAMGLPGRIVAAIVVILLAAGLVVLFADRNEAPHASVYTEVADLEFDDPVLGACVVAFAAMHEWDVSGDIRSLRCNNPDSAKIGSLKGIGNLVNLVDIDLAHNAIRDTGPLESLHHLEVLDLGYNDISRPSLGGLRATLLSLNMDHNRVESLAWVEDVPRLESLSVSHNRIDAIARLAVLEGLRTLRLGSNDIADIGSLRGLTRLEILNLENNRISDVEPLGSLTMLRVLEIGGNRIPEIGALRFLEQVQELDLSGNPMTRIDALGEIRTLNRLDLSNTGVAHFDVLERLGGLELVDLRGTAISCREYEDLAGSLGVTAVRTDLSCDGPKERDSSERQ